MVSPSCMSRNATPPTQQGPVVCMRAALQGGTLLASCFSSVSSASSASSASSSSSSASSSSLIMTEQRGIQRECSGN